MKEFKEVGGYGQTIVREENIIKEITCTCMHTTMEISRHPKDYKLRKSCRHIKEILNEETNKKNQGNAN